MGKVYEEVEVVGTGKSVKVKALFDSGASRGLVSPKVISGIDVVYTGWEPVLKTVGGRYAKVREVEVKNIKLLGHERPRARLYELENLPEEMLIGLDMMQELGVVLEVYREKAILKRTKPNVGFAL